MPALTLWAGDMAAEIGAAYSSTPLAKKLGLRSGLSATLINAPVGYLDWLDAVPPELVFDEQISAQTDWVHLFVQQKLELAEQLARLRAQLRPDAVLWISWPKKSAKVPTDITEDTIRELALPLGWVDIKVCAVNTVWSGLKLMVRKSLR